MSIIEECNGGNVVWKKLQELSERHCFEVVNFTVKF